MKRLINDRLGWAYPRRTERIILIHIAKTAGTSFRKMLQDWYGGRLVYPGDFYLKKMPRGWYPLGSEMLRDYGSLPTHNILVGHFTAALPEMLPQAYLTTTFLREPIQRSLSMLSHFSSTLKVHVQELLEDQQFMSANIADYQTRILGADKVCDPHEVKVVDDTVLMRALSRLQTLDFIGLTERFPESCAIFDTRFKTGISRHIRRENVRRSQGYELLAYISRIEPLIERDRVLYERAVERFNHAE